MTIRGSVQVDLDGWWAYAAAYGEAAPLEPDPVYEDALPRLRESLDRHGVRATLFVVGADLTVPWKRRLIAEMARDGHEIANHTFSHPLGLPGRSRAEIASEIARAEEAIGEAAGTRPVGFRAPGYAACETICAVLEERGYRYDSSLLPTFWGGLIRAYQARGRSGSAASRWCFGRSSHGLAPLRPYLPSRRRIWRPGPYRARAVHEVPVTTTPLLRVPFHSTWVFHFGSGLFLAGLASCRLAGVPINYLFHAIDLISDAAGAAMLARLGIRIPLKRRQRLCDMILRDLVRAGRLVPTREWVAGLASPSFAEAAAYVPERAP